jgi:hypothetical protein
MSTHFITKSKRCIIVLALLTQVAAGDIVDEIQKYGTKKVTQYTKVIDETLSYDDARKQLSQLTDDEDYYYSTNRSHIKLQFGAEDRKFSTLRAITKIRAKLDLPLAKHALKLFIEGDYQDDKILQGVDEEGTSLGLEHSLSTQFDSRLRVGVSRIDNPYIQYRIGIKKQDGRIIFEPYQYLKYSNDNEFEESTNLHIDIIVDERSLYRWHLYRSTQTDQDGMRYGTSLSWYRNLEGDRVIAFSIGGNAETEIEQGYDNRITDYYLTTNWKQNIFKKYMYLYITPSLHFSRETDYTIDPGLKVVYEWRFGNGS